MHTHRTERKIEKFKLFPWGGKIRWRRDRLPAPVFLGFPCGSAGKESACHEGDLGSIPGLGRSLGEGKGYPLQYPGLENFMGYAMQSMESQRVEHDQVTFTFSDEQLRLGLEMYHLDTIFLTRNLKEVLLINIPSPIWMLS